MVILINLLSFENIKVILLHIVLQNFQNFSFEFLRKYCLNFQLLLLLFYYFLGL